jgi:regulator of cell morphogenesis and NO signaling
MNEIREKTIGEIVSDDYRTASVFEKYGIDFCCQGNTSINDACENNGVDLMLVLNDLDSVSRTKNVVFPDYQSWPLDLLADHIVKKHHSYVEEKSLEIKPLLDKICEVHGEQHPELFDIKAHFKAAAGVLAQHMKKEELVLFPFIRKMVKAKAGGIKVDKPHFGTIQNPIKTMMDEHSTEGDRFEKIATLSKNYTPPSDACNTYRVTLSLLKEFEDDLHLHIHLENNILFPKAIELEKELI